MGLFSEGSKRLRPNKPSSLFDLALELPVDKSNHFAVHPKQGNGVKTMANAKTAVITGSTSGIGAAVAEALAGAGLSVCLNGFGDPDAIKAQTAKLESQYGVKAIFHGADMTKPDEISDLINTAEKDLGSVDVLVNNAGIQHVAPVDEFPLDKWDAIIAINMSSNFHTIRAALPGMKSRGYGRIINICSAHGLVASPYKAAYVTAKHGVMGLTKTVALEVAEQGITANSICPGYVLTPLVEKQIPDTAAARGITEDEVVKDILLKAQPTKRFVTVEEVGGTAVFLTKPEAASITGTHITLDGGWTAQ